MHKVTARQHYNGVVSNVSEITTGALIYEYILGTFGTAIGGHFAKTERKLVALKWLQAVCAHRVDQRHHGHRSVLVQLVRQNAEFSERHRVCAGWFDGRAGCAQARDAGVDQQGLKDLPFVVIDPFLDEFAQHIVVFTLLSSQIVVEVLQFGPVFVAYQGIHPALDITASRKRLVLTVTAWTKLLLHTRAPLSLLLFRCCRVIG